MATSLYAPTFSCLQSRPRAVQPPLSCGSKVYEGLRVQIPNTFGAQKSNLNVKFFDDVFRSVYRIPGCKPILGGCTMMPIGVPRVPYRNITEGTWQWLDLWNALYRDRIIFVGQDIDEEFSNQILSTMLYLDSVESSKKMYMYINSPGGDLTPSLALYDTMQSLQSPVATHCLGFANNLAAFILAAGEKDSRTAMPLSRIALQAPAGNAHGQADDVINEAQELIKIRDYLYKELAEKTGQPVEKILKDLRKTLYFTSQTAIEYGIIDRIVRPPPVERDSLKDSTAGLG